MAATTMTGAHPPAGAATMAPGRQVPAASHAGVVTKTPEELSPEIKELMNSLRRLYMAETQVSLLSARPCVVAAHANWRRREPRTAKPRPAELTPSCAPCRDVPQDEYKMALRALVSRRLLRHLMTRSGSRPRQAR